MDDSVARVVIFDVVGTLFDLDPVDQELAAQGAPEGTLEVWFERLLHSATSLTLAGTYAPFAEVARWTLGSVAARANVAIDAEAVVAIFRELPLQTGAEEMLSRLRADGVQLAVLSNGGEDQTRELLERAGVSDAFGAVFSVDAVRRFKPDPAPYRHALSALGASPDQVTFVAAHGWDVLGAERVGMRGIWIESWERTWPLPVPAGRAARDLEHAAALILGDDDA